MTHQQAVSYLFSLLGENGGAGLGLDRMRTLVERLGQPQKSFRVVHVAGTNGKGSTACMIAAGLRASGAKVGFSSSPHLTRFNERIEIDGQPIDDAGFIAAVEEVRVACEAMAAVGDFGRRPTLFEAMMTAAFCAFRRAQVDWGVIEVGLGGRLDASNVVESELAVITPIDLDHESWLGKGLTRIAGEKAGIFRADGRAVSAAQQPEARRALAAKAAELGVDLAFAPELWPLDSAEPDNLGRFELRSGELRVKPALAGEHQVENALTAMAALARLDVSHDAIGEGLESARWAGRLEWFDQAPPILLDAAHNPSGARALAAHLQRFHADREIRLIYGSSRDKAVDEVAGWLFPLAEQVILTRSAVARSARPSTLLGLTDHLHDRIRCIEPPGEALRQARANASERSLIVVAGSIFLLGEIRPQILAE